jgi:hypothetical protein
LPAASLHLAAVAIPDVEYAKVTVAPEGIVLDKLRVMISPDMEAEVTDIAEPESETEYAFASNAPSVAVSPIVIKTAVPDELTEKAVATGGVVSTTTVASSPVDKLFPESTAYRL